MTGLYFSGTGNTRYCAQQFLKGYGGESTPRAMEEPDACRALEGGGPILVAYPIYYSTLPKLVHDFLTHNGAAFRGRTVFILVTQGLFSGDGAGCAARLLRGYGAIIGGGLHVKMPDCIGDERVLKQSLEESRSLVLAGGEKARAAGAAFRDGAPSRDGLGRVNQVAGLLSQRLWFSGKTRHYSDKLNVHEAQCIGCGLCTRLCPMKNLSIVEGKALAGKRCTMCYRCVNHCPGKAITLLGRRVYSQSVIETYLTNEGE